jgi:Lrp/AsnC family transcriptional regulator
MPNVRNFDDIDRRILNALQNDASRSIQEIADEVGLSTNPCWRRIKKLEEDGVIRKRVALLSPAAIGLNVTVFVSVRTENHSKSWLDIFARAVERIPEIVECHRLSGKDDYLLKLQVTSIDHYDSVYKRIVELVPNLVDVSSTFSMETVKYSTSLTIP